ncbi:DUF695 domain-containing protein [Metapseudomonas otitidis]|uniref:DUF695 domain-containing protein n=1 Tax=Metapseudomonas otitidis TaxID=319939 RepID=UPI001F2D336D|nr:DUF695 domain-containing protein [Pseudomonas otitidis]WIF67514.1 DUF695 domain-containing protein [Pseudomonas otitidis]
MTENWDFYFARVDDRPASLFVDLGAVEQAPIERLPAMAYVRVEMNAPRGDGLSSNEEYDALIALEDAVLPKLEGADHAYVGRCTTNGCRDFFFYTAHPQGWEARVAEAFRGFPDYRFEAGSNPDPGWSTYLEYLYPSAIDHQCIQNRRVCQTLEQNGDRLDTPRDIDHWAEFAEAGDAQAFANRAQALGFSLRVPIAANEDGQYSVHLWRKDLPSFAEIDSVTLPLFHLAEDHGGRYDGWETQLVSAD